MKSIQWHDKHHTVTLNVFLICFFEILLMGSDTIIQKWEKWIYYKTNAMEE